MVDAQAAVFVLCVGRAQGTAWKVFRYVEFKFRLPPRRGIAAMLEVRYMLPPLARLTNGTVAVNVVSRTGTADWRRRTAEAI